MLSYINFLKKSTLMPRGDAMFLEGHDEMDIWSFKKMPFDYTSQTPLI